MAALLAGWQQYCLQGHSQPCVSQSSSAATCNCRMPSVALHTLVLTYRRLQDQDDDLAAGIKSTALRFGTESKTWLTGFAAAQLALLGIVGKHCW